MINQLKDEFEQAKDKVTAAAKPVLDRTTRSAAVVGDYVRGSPWAALGIALAAGMLIGFLGGKR